MAKYKNSVIARTESAKGRQLAVSDFVGSRWAAIEAIGATEAAKAGNGSPRSLQAVSANGVFSALIKHGNTTLQFEGDKFAVSTHD